MTTFLKPTPADTSMNFPARMATTDAAPGGAGGFCWDWPDTGKKSNNRQPASSFLHMNIPLVVLRRDGSRVPYTRVPEEMK